MKALLALAALVLFVALLSPSSPRSADAQPAIWTSCRNVCMRSCQWEKGEAAGNQCWEAADCKPLQNFFAPSDPRIDTDKVFTATRLAQCKRCAATGRQGRCPADMFDASTGGVTYGGASYGGARYGGRDPIGAFARCFEESAADRIAEGYYVKNAELIRQVRGAGSANPFLDKTRGGRSGEYGAWGMRWIKPCVDQHVPGALVDELVVEAKSLGRTKRARETAGSIYEASHRATRVVFPDGRRVVVDYWSAIASGRAELVMQTRWAQDWRERIGAPAVVLGSDDEAVLGTSVKKLGADKAFAQFKKQKRNEIWIASYKREPW